MAVVDVEIKPFPAAGLEPADAESEPEEFEIVDLDAIAGPDVLRGCGDDNPYQ